MTNDQKQIVLNSNKLTNTDKSALIVKFMRDESNIKSSKDTIYTAHQYSDYYNRGNALYEMNKNFRDIYNKLKLKNETKDINMIGLVKQFRKAFKLGISEKPTLIPKAKYDLHYLLLKEEIEEYMDACEAGDKVEVLDALVDIAYIMFGAVLEHGMEEVFEDAFQEIHASNMSKLEKGMPIYNAIGKVMKGRDYFRPELGQYINNNN